MADGGALGLDAFTGLGTDELDISSEVSIFKHAFLKRTPGQLAMPANNSRVGNDTGAWIVSRGLDVAGFTTQGTTLPSRP